LQVVRCVRVCRHRRTRGCTCALAKRENDGKKTRREPVRGFRLELERLTARATGFGGISGVSATGIGKAGGGNKNCFFSSQKKNHVRNRNRSHARSVTRTESRTRKADVLDTTTDSLCHRSSRGFFRSADRDRRGKQTRKQTRR
jgi:hypothetical protein